MMCVFFYLPRVLWQSFCYKKLGVDLENLIQKANKIRNENNTKKETKPIADKIESILYCHRDYREGKISNIRRSLNDMFGILVASKRLGTWLSFWYFVMKIAYLVNAVCQLVLISRLFNSKKNVLSFSLELYHNTVNFIPWSNTRVFPRVTYCYINNVLVSGQHENGYVAQCALPQNMLNEKLFLICFTWIFFVAVATAVSILIWVKRMFFHSRIQFIKKFLKLDESYGIHKRDCVTKFVAEFLQHDGFLIIQMIYLNSGDLVTTAIVANLFESYEAKHANRDLRNLPYYLINDYSDNNMAVKLPPAMNSAKKNPSAPIDRTEFV